MSCKWFIQSEMINSTFFIRAHFNDLETGLDVVRIYSGSLQNNMLGLCRDI